LQVVEENLDCKVARKRRACLEIVLDKVRVEVVLFGLAFVAVGHVDLLEFGQVYFIELSINCADEDNFVFGDGCAFRNCFLYHFVLDLLDYLLMIFGVDLNEFGLLLIEVSNDFLVP
jgi:hypothetical protein